MVYPSLASIELISALWSIHMTNISGRNAYPYSDYSITSMIKMLKMKMKMKTIMKMKMKMKMKIQSWMFSSDESCLEIKVM